MTTDTTAILDRVIWIVEQLDADGLHEVSDVPVLELAKHVSVPRVRRRDPAVHHQ